MSDPKPSVSDVLSMPDADVIAFLGPIYEHSSWVAEILVANLGARRTSIGTVSALAAEMKSVVNGSSNERKLGLLRAHPDLCEKVSKLKELTAESQTEQGRAGLQSMTDDEMRTFQENNNLYRQKFEFPFILAVRNATKSTVLAALQGRVNRSYQDEFATALEQVHKIAWMRLLSKLDLSACQGFLTCHVLDTANGCPGAFSRGSFQVVDRVFDCQRLTFFASSRTHSQRATCGFSCAAFPRPRARGSWGTLSPTATDGSLPARR